MINQGNVLPPAGGKKLYHFSPYPDNNKSESSGVPTAEPMGDEGLSVPFGKSKKPFQLNIRPIADAPGERPNPKRTMLPESDDALEQYAPIQGANLSQGVFNHEVNVDIPWEGFNDPANLKV